MRVRLRLWTEFRTMRRVSPAVLASTMDFTGKAMPMNRRAPLGPLLAAAAQEGYTSAEVKPLAPYHGYYYKILTRQGDNAPGGAYDYFVRGKLIGGFAVRAYPARYGASGVMTFMFNHDGVVYEKNLGRKTQDVAAGISRFDPDQPWHTQ